MPSKWWILGAVACGTFMATLDSSIVNIALPTITKDLVTDLPGSKWVVIIYYLVITCLLLPFGSIAAIYGRKKAYLIGFAIFTLGSLSCGLSVSLTLLIISRIIQASGAAMLMANGPAVITSSFPANERGKALGILAMAVSVGLFSGPAFGGLIIDHFGWRSIFLVNIPVGILGGYLVYQFLSKDVPEVMTLAFDWMGTILQTFFLLSLILLFDPPKISISGSVPLSIPYWILILISAIFCALFLKVELVAERPVLDLSLLKIRTFWTANLSAFLFFVAYSAISVLFPFFLEDFLGLATSRAGLFMTAIPLAIFIVAPISGRLSDTFGSQELSFTGAMCSALCMLIMSGAISRGLDEATALPTIFFLLAFIGFSLGLFQSPNNNAIMGAVPDEKLSSASALLATVRNLGLVIGTGFAASVFQLQRDQGRTFIESLHFSYLLAAFIAILSAIAALGKKRGAYWKASR